jgi:two-component system sensor histidine kinase HupT/HoxJ
VTLAKVVLTASQWAARSDKNQVAIETKLEADLFVLGLEGKIHSVIGNALDAVRDCRKPGRRMRGGDRMSRAAISDALGTGGV